MARLATLRISADSPAAHTASIVLDDQDISHAVRRVELDMQVGRINVARVEMAPGAIYATVKAKVTKRFRSADGDPIWWHPKPGKAKIHVASSAEPSAFIQAMRRAEVALDRVEAEGCGDGAV